MPATLHRSMNLAYHEEIEDSGDVARVRALPRREPATPELVEAMSAFLRVREFDAEGRRNLLRPPQAEALRELFELRGLVAPMRVGSGKTLVTLLAATLLGAQRPVLMLPATLRDKTRKEFARYRLDWRVRLPEIVSYQELGRPDREAKLFELDPDLLLCDEAHYARNLDSAVSRRIERFIAARRPVVANLSGTLMTDRLLDYHHHTVWSLGENAPMPVRQADAERWARALDKEVPRLDRLGLGDLEQLPGGFFEWFRGSRGVVPTPGSDCDASIQIKPWAPELSDELRQIIATVQTTKMRPDLELLDEWELPDCLCQLAQGFYYVWDPLPPSWWLRPRRGWREYAKAVLDERLEGFDSESQIVRALDREPGHGVRCVDSRPEPPAAAEGRQLLAAWREVRDQFTPNPVPVWLDVRPLQQAIEFAGARGCLVWTKHRAAGFMLQALGLPYYGGGTDPEPVNGRSIAVSIAAHGTGRNLQAWHRSLVLVPPAKADKWEQLIGRTHRANQKSDTVYVDPIAAIHYHGEVLGRVYREAVSNSRASGFDHKLMIADWV